MNRIVEVYKKNGQQEETISKYIYDTLGRLVRENNKDKNVTNIMSYDGNGNILTKDVAGYTESQYVNYTRYSSSYSPYYIDEIVSYNNQSITTSETGNITQIGTKEFKWTRGNLLSQVNNSNKNTYYSYDASGVRINKTTNENGITKSHEYQCEGTRILKEKITKNEQTQILEYIYLANQIVGFKYQGNYYFFQKNLQGDIIKIYDINNTLVAHYKYDAWGNHTVYDSNGNVNTLDTFIGNINPFRYRGYYYDVETGLFWLSSRYYSPELCRFISPDDVGYLDPSSINGLNLYSYCGNDPINRYDPSGHFWDYVFDAAFIAWGIYDLVNGGYKDWKNWVALGVDIVFAVLPFVPSGAGQVIKVGNKIDNAVDVASAINKIDNIQDMSKVTMIGRSMDRVTDTATLIGKADNLYDAWKGYDATATGLKRVAHNGISMLHDAGWMFGKLRSGYTVIDIGMTTLHRGRGLYYGAERFVIGLWKTRNLWKLPINYYF